MPPPGGVAAGPRSAAAPRSRGRTGRSPTRPRTRPPAPGPRRGPPAQQPWPGAQRALFLVVRGKAPLAVGTLRLHGVPAARRGLLTHRRGRGWRGDGGGAAACNWTRCRFVEGSSTKRAAAGAENRQRKGRHHSSAHTIRHTTWRGSRARSNANSNSCAFSAWAQDRKGSADARRRGRARDAIALKRFSACQLQCIWPRKPERFLRSCVHEQAWRLLLRAFAVVHVKATEGRAAARSMEPRRADHQPFPPLLLRLTIRGNAQAARPPTPSPPVLCASGTRDARIISPHRCPQASSLSTLS